MGELWSDFLVGFCKVDAVCWYGEPNWFGWLIIGVGSFVICMTALNIYASRL